MLAKDQEFNFNRTDVTVSMYTIQDCVDEYKIWLTNKS